MATYLLKTEPGDYANADLVRDKKTVWDGVTNPTACMHMRGVRRGDEAFIYHTGSEKAVVGLARVVSDPRADPGKEPAHTAAGDLKYPVFDVKPLGGAETPLTLADMKAAFARLGLSG